METQIDVKLTKRENQVAGLAFCGKAKKEIADALDIAYGTVTIILNKAYRKTGTSKLNELGSWWANKEFEMNIDFEKLQKTIVALLLFGVMICQSNSDFSAIRCRRRVRGRRARTEEVYINSKININKAA